VFLSRSQLAAIAIAALTLPTHLSAQCADGSPPPCPASVTRVAAREPRETRPPDPNRIAILPFRVTTTDTLLGEGFAELLATEFTGEGAPRAVDMATVLSAWRRAGGGLRTPLPRSKAMEVAREVGAGLVSEGSIVGLGRNITVTASLLSSTDGVPRGSPSRVTTAADSLESALRQSATNLLGAIGGERSGGDGARYTDSPEAMRSYLQGLSAWRRGRIGDAAQDFDRAIASDSSFAQAWFRRYLVAVWTSGTAPFQRPAWERRSRLSLQERTILEGMLGTDYPRPRTIEERFADRERFATRLPDSPDALYLFGDYLFHYGAAVDQTNHLTRARDLMVRAVTLDSATTTLRHLLEVGIQLRDTALLRTVLPAYLRTEDAGRLQGAWLAAASIGDAATVASVRRRDFPSDGGESFWAGGAAMVANVPLATLDEIFARWATVASADRRADLLGFQGVIAVARGRPAAAQRLWAGLPESALRDADRSLIRLDIAGAANGIDVKPSVRRLRASSDTAVNDDACLVAVWRARNRDTVGLTLSRFVVPRASVQCALTVQLVSLPRDGSESTRTRLMVADSVARNRFGSIMAVGNGFESLLLAEAWEAHGDRTRALTAIRYRTIGLGLGIAPWTLPYEARLAAATGDTAGAVRAYRYWLDLNADAEPAVVPKRDSVRAELSRLTRKLVP
jgi:TolB-like protein